MASRNVIVILDSNSKVDTVSILTSVIKENVLEFLESNGKNRNQLEFPSLGRSSGHETQKIYT